MHLARLQQQRLHQPLVGQQQPHLHLLSASLRHLQLRLASPVHLVLLQLVEALPLVAVVVHLVRLLRKPLAAQALHPLQVAGVAGSMHLASWQQLVAAAQALVVVGLGAAQGLARQGVSSSSSQRLSKVACGR
jgi:hypothetical protein